MKLCIDGCGRARNSARNERCRPCYIRWYHARRKAGEIRPMVLRQAEAYATVSARRAAAEQVKAAAADEAARVTAELEREIAQCRSIRDRVCHFQTRLYWARQIAVLEARQVMLA